MKDFAISALLVMDAVCRKGDVSGSMIMEQTDLKSGTVYPLLKRLEADGFVRSRNEDGTPEGRGRPLRIFYTATRKGVRAVASQASRLKPTIDRLTRLK